MKVQNKNASSKKTKDLIKNTFSNLIKKKPNLKEITVTELTSIANITRSSFYTHYDNIYEVAKELQDEAIESFIEKYKDVKDFNDINKYFDEVCTFFKKDLTSYKTLLQGDFAIMLLERLRKQTEKNLYEYLKSKNIDNLNLKITFFTDGCILLIIKYFKGELSESLDEINSYMKDTFKTFFSN